MSDDFLEKEKLKEQAALSGINLDVSDIAAAHVEAQQKQQQLKIAAQEESKRIDTQLENKKRALRIRAVNFKKQLANQAKEFIQKIKQRKATIDLAKYRSELEQSIFIAKLNNQKYIDNLKLEAARKRLDNHAEFQSALIDAAFKDDLDIIRQNASLSRILTDTITNAKIDAARTEAAYTKELAKIDLETAYQMAMSDMKLAIAQQQYNALIGSITQLLNLGLDPNSREALLSIFKKGDSDGS
ncbi:MAG: hypothetical protein QXT25_04650 [Candidatus Anstonellaceae archaeon]